MPDINRKRADRESVSPFFLFCTLPAFPLKNPPQAPPRRGFLFGCPFDFQPFNPSTFQPFNPSTFHLLRSHAIFSPSTSIVFMPSLSSFTSPLFLPKAYVPVVRTRNYHPIYQEKVIYCFKSMNERQLFSLLLLQHRLLLSSFLLPPLIA